MSPANQSTIDLWISLDSRRCVVYSGGGQWWPAVETHDGPQQIELGAEFTLTELVAWCDAQVAWCDAQVVRASHG